MKKISTEKSIIYTGDQSLLELKKFLSAKSHSCVFILMDENTKKYCLPLLKKDSAKIAPLHYIQIKSGEKNKTIHTCIKIWKELSKQNADRNSLLICLGGGVITDIGGFAASVYKRGIDFINIPTTLLAQADASIGGKNGIDLFGFKNQIGTFALPKAIFIVPSFLKTSDKRQMLSAFAEMIKHGLIADKNYYRTLASLSPLAFTKPFGEVREIGILKKRHWEEIISRSIQIKKEIVSNDPFEKKLRKALNFGHTIGHAIESASLQKDKKPLLHGEAIATGMICETYLSRKCCGLSNKEMNDIISLVLVVFNLNEIRYPIKNIIRLMKQDKKNQGSGINFTLLSAIGKAEINNFCTTTLVEESIRFFNSIYSQFSQYKKLVISPGEHKE